MSDTPQPPPPPGWYPDPHGHGQRYWDGQAWTENMAASRQPHKGVPYRSAAGGVMSGQGAYPPQQHTWQPIPVQEKNTIATAGMVLGIISIVLVWVPIIGMLTLPTTILALIFGGVGLAKAKGLGGVGRAQAIAALATGGVTMIVGLAIFFGFMALGWD